MTIRPAIAEDIPRMVEMGRRFRAESSYSSHFSDNPAQMEKLGQKLLASGGGILVADSGEDLVGMLGYIVYPHFISGETVAGEVFWWVDPDHRGITGLRLLREAERKAKAAGAKQMQMIAPDEGIGKLYKRRGYTFIESTYQRNL